MHASMKNSGLCLMALCFLVWLGKRSWALTAWINSPTEIQCWLVFEGVLKIASTCFVFVCLRERYRLFQHAKCRFHAWHLPGKTGMTREQNLRSPFVLDREVWDICQSALVWITKARRDTLEINQQTLVSLSRCSPMLLSWHGVAQTCITRKLLFSSAERYPTRSSTRFIGNPVVTNCSRTRLQEGQAVERKI